MFVTMAMRSICSNRFSFTRAYYYVYISEYNVTIRSQGMLTAHVLFCLPSWYRLTDCLQGYIPDCNDNNVQDLEEKLNDFPEDVLVEHAVHVWHITVRHHQDLLQNASSECY